MKITRLGIPEMHLIESRVFGGRQGFFLVSFYQRQSNEAIGREVLFVQHNHSRSARNVLRCLHCQVVRPREKLLRVVQSEASDLAVDIRKSSPTFVKWVAEILSAGNKKQFWISRGFTHGFAIISQDSGFIIKKTVCHAPEHGRRTHWNDPEFHITWPLAGVPQMAEKNQSASSLINAEHFR